MSIRLGQNHYGKSQVRLMKVTRHPDRHELKEVAVNISFEGDFDKVHVQGDNRPVLPTDTMKNTVYALARNHPFHTIEDFGCTLADHFLNNNPQVSQVTIDLTEYPWERIPMMGSPVPLHPYSFLRGGNQKETSTVTLTRSDMAIRSGITDLLILKTTKSGFEAFKRDAFTTLKETDDRILATNLTAVWLYTTSTPGFFEARATIMKALLESFAEHDSKSVQHTLYAMGKAALEACPEISEIHFSMPNKHCLLVNLEPFGMENKNEIFVPTDEPFGLIEGTVRRD